MPAPPEYVIESEYEALCTTAENGGRTIKHFYHRYRGWVSTGEAPLKAGVTGLLFRATEPCRKAVTKFREIKDILIDDCKFEVLGFRGDIDRVPIIPFCFSFAAAFLSVEMEVVQRHTSRAVLL